MKRLSSKRSDICEVVFLVAGLALYCLLVYFLKLPCPIYFFTGVSCPGCGMTRALFSLMQFDFNTALYYHPLIFFCAVLFPVLAIVHLKKKYTAKKILILIFIVVFITTYLYRFLILKSPILKFSPENGFFVKFYTGIFS